MLGPVESAGRTWKRRFASSDFSFVRVLLVWSLLSFVTACVHTSTPSFLGHEGDRRILISRESPAEHRSTTVVHGVVHTITAPRAGYMRCGSDTVATIEADTTQRPNAYELATVDGEHPRLSRALCLDVLGGHNNPPTAALEPDLAPGPP